MQIKAKHFAPALRCKPAMGSAVLALRAPQETIHNNHFLHAVFADFQRTCSPVYTGLAL